ncbi:MAG: SGNH hydrolase domain-containing protein [Actinomycetota bacterium]
MKRRGFTATGAIFFLASLLAGSGTAAASTSVPTATALTKLVASSTTLQRLSPALQAFLPRVARDNYEVYDPSCVGLSPHAKCDFGAVALGVKRIVLFGDSHAQMWLPALNQPLSNAGYRLHLRWKPGCQAQMIHRYDPSTHAYDTGCESWRLGEISQIIKERPSLIIMTGRSSNMFSAASKYFTDAQWQAATLATIARFKQARISVLVMGDIPMFAQAPATCMSRHARDIQACSTAASTTLVSLRAHTDAEALASRRAGVNFIDPRPWLCTTRCSPVIDGMVTYTDNNHLTLTYALFLRNIVSTAVLRFVPRLH